MPTLKSNSFGALSKKLTAIADGLPNNVNKVVRKTGLVIHQVATVGTPVDTGYARGNWLVTSGAPAPSAIEPKNLGAQESTKAAITQEALNNAEAAIAAHPPGQDLYITNNTEYIVPLDNGHSAQAPQGMSRLAVQAGKAYAQGAKIELT